MSSPKASEPPPSEAGPPPTPLPAISRRKVAAGVAAVLVLVAAAVVALWWPATRGLDGKDLVTARLDAVKVGLSLGVGGGGLFALYLTWRRQRATEATLAHQLEVAADTKAHQERVAADAREDATARRITELYTKAVEQLGSDKAAVRLGGLYALERLAQDNPDQRQTIVNVLCAYLRMPYEPPGRLPIGAGEPKRQANQERIQEREVRLTAQAILVAHLQPKAADRFWAGVQLNLSGALLINFDLWGVEIPVVNFSRATFKDAASFTNTKFTGLASFSDATFEDVWFDDVVFTGSTRFNNACFANGVDFSNTTFDSRVTFDRANFDGYTQFRNSTFRGVATFRAAAFARDARFDHVIFDHDAIFRGATFNNTAVFSDVTFKGFAFLDLATAERFSFDRVRTFTANEGWPSGWTASGPDEAENGVRLVQRESDSGQPSAEEDLEPPSPAS